MTRNRRMSIRLTHYDYSQAGFYFITICTKDRNNLFGEIIEDKMLPNAAGQQVNQTWLDIPEHFHDIKLHHHIVMPNHIHGILELVGASLVGARSSHKGQPQGIAPTVGDVVGAFKSLSTNAYISGVKHKGWKPFNQKLWQRNYYEHVIRDDDSFLEISEYIETNPQRWQEDKYYTL